MKKLKVLVTAPLHHINNQKIILSKLFDCIFVNHNSIKKINNLLINCDGWICSPSPTKLISLNNYTNIKYIKFIATPSTGTTHISQELKKSKNIKILSLSLSKKINSIKASSEYTFSLALSLIKKIPFARDFVHFYNWRNIEDKLRSNELFEKNVGIIGYGRIGRNIAKYSKAFGMKTIIYDIKKNFNNFNKSINLKKIISNDEIIFLCISYNPSNINFINQKFFESLKKMPYIINTSRGEMIDENSLLFALKNRLIKGAAIDVLTDEQNLDLRKNKLVNYSKKNKNLIITPHIAGLTYESEAKAMSLTIELIRSHYKNE